MLNREEFLNKIGYFSWDYGQTFHILVDDGVFAWSDPDYGGDNTIRFVASDWGSLLKMLPDEWCCLDKGVHRIRDFCGDSVILIG